MRNEDERDEDIEESKEMSKSVSWSLENRKEKGDWG